MRPYKNYDIPIKGRGRRPRPPVNYIILPIFDKVKANAGGGTPPLREIRYTIQCRGAVPAPRYCFVIFDFDYDTKSSHKGSFYLLIYRSLRNPSSAQHRAYCSSSYT